ncbi:MAG: AAA family ATPase [Proteobacteria bacterium]|nr:AAA family ATPase [Pseudomonadota bacterium]
MAKGSSRNSTESQIRKFMINRSKNLRAPQSSGCEDLQRYYQQCSLVLIGAAAGWIEGHEPVLNAASRSSTRCHERFIQAGLNEREASCLDYVTNEFTRIDARVFFSENGPIVAKFNENLTISRAQIRTVVDSLQKNFQFCSSQPRTPPLPFELQKLHEDVSRQLSLTEAEHDVFALSLVVSMVRCSFSHFATELSGLTPRLCAAVISKLCGHSEQAVLTVLSPSGTLARVGILDAEDCLEGEHFKDFLRLGEKFRRWAAEETTKENPTYELLTQVSRTQLGLADFEHLSEELALAQRILCGAMDEGKTGINILLVGPPGSGKTEMTKVIAQALDSKLFQVDFIDAEGNQLSMDAGERLKSYNLGQRLLAKSKRSMLLFDEIEDVLEDSNFLLPKGLSRSKAYTNNLLETNSVPTIWVTNRLRRMDPAWLRRFSFVMEVPVPPRAARERILSRLISNLRHPAIISEDMKRRIIDVEGLSAGQLKVAFKALDCGRSAQETTAFDRQLELLLREPLRLAHGLNGLPKAGRYKKYDVAYVNAGVVNVNDVVEGIERNSRARILLSGPPGTGKTGFAHFVAQRIGKPLLRKTAADLLGSFVGESERAIAAMFTEAERNDCVLLLDEVDGLMRNRRFAERQWEVTQVNELLLRMEDFRGVFLCSTNHAEQLDPATVRRFLFRLEFNYLNENQALALLQKYLKTDCTAGQIHDAGETLKNLRMLTPADFSNVHERLSFLGIESSLNDFLRHLRQEVEAKLEEKNRQVGFGQFL